uniref:penicillin acylase family protein n=1 Tax=Cellulomonas citrea TaxID=1909423 RepID=UPI001B355896
SWLSVDLKMTSPELLSGFWDEVAETTSDARVSKDIHLLQDWDEQFTDADGDGAYDHPGVALFRIWLMAARDEIFTDELGEWSVKFEDHNYIKYGTSLTLRALEGETAGRPMKWDFLNGRSRSAVVEAILLETIDRLERKFGADMDEWLQPVYWRYMGQEAFYAPDPDRPTVEATDYAGSTTYVGAGVKIGALEKAVPHNGAPYWMTLMEIGDLPPAIESITPAGGQDWFINLAGQASKHINDQTVKHLNYEFKSVPMSDEALASVKVSAFEIHPDR